MRNKYPEHIDQIDGFYQSQLKDVEILPQAELWDKISAAYEKEQTQRKGGFFTFVEKNKNTLILLALLMSFIGTYLVFFSNNQDKVQQNIPAQEQEEHVSAPALEKDTPAQDNSDLVPLNNASKITPGKSLPKHNKNNLNNNTDAQIIPENNSVKTPVSEEAPLVQENTDNKQPAEPESVKPKEKVKFKDKYKKEYQDSTRNLFVPEK